MKRFDNFRGLLISYILVTLIPMGVFIALIVHNTQKAYEEELFAGRLGNLQRVRDVLDLRIRECRNLSLQLSQNVYMSRYNLTNTSYQAYLGIDELRKYKSGNEFLSDVALAFHDHDRLYSSNGATTIQVALQVQYQLGAGDAGKLEMLLTRVNTPTVFSSENKRRLFYLVPIPMGSMLSNSTALFVFGDHSMSSLFQEQSGDFGDMRFLLDHNGRLIYSMDGSGLVGTDAFMGILQSGLEEKQKYVNYNKLTYRVISVNSPETGWQLVALLPIDQIQRIVRGWDFLMIIASAVMMVCITLAIWFASRYWAPIRQLGYIVMGHKPHKKEWGSIHSAVEQTLSQNRFFSKQLERQQVMLRENLILRLIHGSPEDDASLEKNMAQLGMPTRIAGCCAFAVAIYRSVEDNSRSLMDSINGLWPDSVYAVEIGPDNRIIVIVFLKEGEGAERVESIAGDIHTHLTPLVKGGFAIGMGKAAASVRQLKWSYMQAVVALEHVNVEWDGIADFRIIKFEQITGESYLLPELREKELYMLVALRQGDAGMAQNMLEEIIHYASASAPSMIHFTCFRILDRIMSVLAGNVAIPAEEVLSPEVSWHTMVDLINMSMIEEYKRQASLVIERICSQFRQADRQKDDRLVQNIEEYVKQHYLDKNLSLDDLSKAFGSSRYYWSRFFKERIGQNFSEYVWNLRLAQAKYLLQNTNKPVKDIVDEIGYIDTRSFIRKFKSCEGITPAQFKCIHSGGTVLQDLGQA